MKIIWALLLIASAALARSPVESREVNMQEPPFYMPSYDEFHDLQDFQKSFYVKNFLRDIAAIPELRDVNAAGMKEASDWDDSWNEIRVKLYRVCQEKDSAKECDKLADLRVEALELARKQ